MCTRKLLAVGVLATLGWLTIGDAREVEERPTHRRQSPTHRMTGSYAPDPHSPVALKRLDGCDSLRAYMVDAIVETLVRDLYWWSIYPAIGGPEFDAGAGRPADFTTTNVQEQGVDELDLVKTDGDYLYVASDRGLAVVDSWPPPSSRLAARLDLDGTPHGLFLFGDLVLLVSHSYRGVGLMPEMWAGTRIDVVDVSDRSAPRSVRTLEVEGWFVAARMINGHVYAVLQSSLEIPSEAWDLIWSGDLELPELPPDATDADREAASRIAREILRPHVDGLLVARGVDSLLPLLVDSDGGAGDPRPVPLVGCGNLYRPPDPSEFALLSVLHLDLNPPAAGRGALSTTGLLADGWTVYASIDNLYVAQSNSWWRWGPWAARRDMATTIHEFSLDPDGPAGVRYRASGEVAGWLLDQFSMSEHAGHLRVATTEFDWWLGGGDENRDPGNVLTVLRDNRRGELVEVGRLDGIAPGERIYACRFMGDVGYLVTFVQVDPLFTLDLSDPTTPRLLGELEIPGYSAYLHPLGDHHLLAVGMQADDQGALEGLALSLFDVSDLSSPRLAHRYAIEDDAKTWSWSEALSDHHAFTFARGVLSIPAYLSDHDGWFSGLFVFSVDVDEGFGELGTVGHDDLPADEWGSSAWMRRSVYIEDFLYSLSSRGIKVNSLLEPAIELAEVPFFAAPPEAP